MDVLTVEIILSDGTAIRWARPEANDSAIDRLLRAVEDIIGKPDTIKV